MSSNNKTPNLNLNLWEGSDKPKRMDFNHDNEVIDTVLGGHVANDGLHLSTEDRDKLTSPFFIGNYVGDGANTRVMTLDFEPSFIIIFSNHVPLATYDKATDHVYAFAGMATTHFASTGLSLSGNKLTITDSTGSANVSNYYPRLNTSSYRYNYIAFK